MICYLTPVQEVLIVFVEVLVPEVQIVVVLQGENPHGSVKRLLVLIDRLFGKKSLHPVLKEPSVEADLLEHAEEVLETGTEAVEPAEDVLFAEAELANLLAHPTVLDAGVGVLVLLPDRLKTIRRRRRRMWNLAP